MFEFIKNFFTKKETIKEEEPLVLTEEVKDIQAENKKETVQETKSSLTLENNMGSNSASTGGGGGGVGPAGITTQRTYGTKKQAKKVSRRNELRTFIKKGGIIGSVIEGVTGKTPYERNLERRQKFIKR